MKTNKNQPYSIIDPERANISGGVRLCSDGKIFSLLKL